MRQQDRRDPDVIIDHLALGETDLRVKNLVQVRNRELFSFNDQFSFFLMVESGPQRKSVIRKAWRRIRFP